jgi:hypothetical protein
MQARWHPRSRANEQSKKERNNRVFAVPDGSPLETDLKEIRHLPSRAREELEHFFRATDYGNTGVDLPQRRLCRRRE